MGLVMLPPQVTMRPLGQIKAKWPNARTHSKRQIRQIASSILRNGWTHPLLLVECGYRIAGEGRCRAAEELGRKEVPVIVLKGLSDAAKRAFALADNKIAAN